MPARWPMPSSLFIADKRLARVALLSRALCCLGLVCRPVLARHRRARRVSIRCSGQVLVDLPSDYFFFLLNLPDSDYCCHNFSSIFNLNN
jgi:hypothetical protein